MAPPPPIDDGTSVTMTATSAREVAAGRGLYRLDGWALREQAGHAAAEQPDSLPFKDPFEGFKVRIHARLLLLAAQYRQISYV